MIHKFKLMVFLHLVISKGVVHFSSSSSQKVYFKMPYPLSIAIALQVWHHKNIGHNFRDYLVP